MGMPLPDRKKATIGGKVNEVIHFHRTFGFRVRMVFANPEFEYLRGKLDAALQTVGCQEHVGDIERKIRTVKQKMRSVWASLPFKKLPKLMVGHLYKFVLL